MNIAILDFPATEPTAREMMDRALDPHILLGMPHLTPRGLSETWLMKELGHRHWLMLGRHLGMENAAFVTPDGEEAYAAICATSLKHAQFDGIRANDVLTIRSVLTSVSRTQVSTCHRLYVENETVGNVELISAFVHRAIPGDNHSVARVAQAGTAHTGYKRSELATTASELRGGRLETHLGMPVSVERPLRGFLFEPDVSQEFNGAGLFYFAQFQALVDRAFDRWFPHGLFPRLVGRRDVFFTGNVRQREVLHVELMWFDPERGTASCRISREDGRVIGRVFVYT